LENKASCAVTNLSHSAFFRIFIIIIIIIIINNKCSKKDAILLLLLILVLLLVDVKSYKRDSLLQAARMVAHYISKMERRNSQVFVPCRAADAYGGVCAHDGLLVRPAF